MQPGAQILLQLERQAPIIGRCIEQRAPGLDGAVRIVGGAGGVGFGAKVGEAGHAASIATDCGELPVVAGLDLGLGGPGMPSCLLPREQDQCHDDRRDHGTGAEPAEVKPAIGARLGQ